MQSTAFKRKIDLAVRRGIVPVDTTSVERGAWPGEGDGGIERSPVDDLVTRAPSCDLTEGESHVSVSNGAVVASKKLWIRRSLAVVAPMLDPRNWPLHSAFFLETRKLDPPYDPGPAGRVPWRGRLLEVFVVDFMGVRLNRFQVTLDIDVTITADLVRTDYSLVHEKNDRLLVDDGYLQVRKVPGHPGWTEVDGTKVVKFRSIVTNFLAPLGCLLLAAQDPLRIFTERGDGSPSGAPRPSPSTVGA